MFSIYNFSINKHDLFVFEKVRMKLEELLTIPSIRSNLDSWLMNSEFGGGSKFNNNLALQKMEKQIIYLHENFNVPLTIGLQVVTDSAEAIMEEIYS